MTGLVQVSSALGELKVCTERAPNHAVQRTASQRAFRPLFRGRLIADVIRVNGFVTIARVQGLQWVTRLACR